MKTSDLPLAASDAAVFDLLWQFYAEHSEPVNVPPEIAAEVTAVFDAIVQGKPLTPWIREMPYYDFLHPRAALSEATAYVARYNLDFIADILDRMDSDPTGWDTLSLPYAAQYIQERGLFEGFKGRHPVRVKYETPVVLTSTPAFERDYGTRIADKRNLTLLSNSAQLASWGLAPEHVDALGGVPLTRLVTPENADELWSARKGLFFKPTSGHGGKAVYRGDKVTKGVWEVIARGDYVAQAFAAPGERMIEIDGQRVSRKMDVRLYTYEGRVLLAAARLYQGQTTNFRTPGGGFAPVLVV